jgi:hypothetical protein
MLCAILILVGLQQPAEALQRALLPEPPVFALPPPPVADIQKSIAGAKSAGLGLAGVHRDIGKAARNGSWHDLGKPGWIWCVKVVSPGASGIRVHVKNFDSSKGTLQTIEPGSNVRTPWNGEWSQLTFGESVVILFESAGGKKLKKLPFSLDRISHQLR